MMQKRHNIRRDNASSGCFVTGQQLMGPCDRNEKVSGNPVAFPQSGTSRIEKLWYNTYGRYHFQFKLSSRQAGMVIR